MADLDKLLENNKILNKVNWDDIQRKDGLSISHCLPGILPQTSDNYGMFFITRHPIEIMVVEVIWAVAGSASPTLQVERLQGTTSPGSGDNILTSAIDLSGSANTLIKLEKTNLTSARLLKEGNRLALVDSGALTALKDLCITIYYKYRGRGNYR